MPDQCHILVPMDKCLQLKLSYTGFDTQQKLVYFISCFYKYQVCLRFFKYKWPEFNLKIIIIQYIQLYMCVCVCICETLQFYLQHFSTDLLDAFFFVAGGFSQFDKWPCKCKSVKENKKSEKESRSSSLQSSACSQGQSANDSLVSVLCSGVLRSCVLTQCTANWFNLIYIFSPVATWWWPACCSLVPIKWLWMGKQGGGSCSQGLL